MKKENNLVARIRVLRKKIRERVKEKVLSEYEEKKKSGKYPWEGMWLTSQEIYKVQARMKKRDRVVFVEVLFLFLLLTFSSIMLSVVINSLLSGQVGESIKNPIGRDSQLKRQTVHLKDGESVSHVDLDNSLNGKIGSDTRGFPTVVIDSERVDLLTGDQNGMVKTDILRLLKGPESSYVIISQLKFGEIITVKDKIGKWLKIMADESLDG